MNPEEIIRIAELAGRKILEIYNRDEELRVMKKGDNSPLTEADLAAHNIIISHLKELDDTPIVSEEGTEGDPVSSKTCWLVDPLDGTKEFIKRNGMFTVNIALMQKEKEHWKPIFGVVHAPVTKTTWWGGLMIPAERQGPDGSGLMMVQPHPPSLPVRLVASGSHRSELDEKFAQTLGNYNLIRMGSSLKACIIAEGNADLYPRFGPTSCWDIAAAHAIVSSAGGLVLNAQGNTLNYDITGDVLNPYFLIASDNRWTKDWIYQNNAN
ncbi:MAG: 3'(2'),5'-bisphosphate nucleotidase CysQ [Candidatus Thalassarchaeaceae archaeon]